MKRLMNLSSLVLLALFALPLVTVGCGENRGYGYRYYDSQNNRYYDPYYNDYHYWTPAEQGYYNQYYRDNHRQYRDLRRLNGDEQKQYWHWRHEQAEHHGNEHHRR